MRGDAGTTEAAAPEALVEVRMLGGFAVTVGGLPIVDAAWRGRKARTLVKLLCLAPSHRLHREQLLDALWPTLEPTAASNNLRSALHAARRALQPELHSAAGDSVLVSEGPLVFLRDDGRLRVDVVEFEHAAADARREGTVERLRNAVALYAGDLLPEEMYEDWAARRRDALRDSAVSLLIELADQLWQSDPREAIGLFQRVLHLDPADERAHVGLMRSYAVTNQRRQALTQYERMRTVLRAELDVEPDPSSEQLYGAILSGQFTTRWQAESRADSSPVHHSNLPNPLTSFIGREDDIDRIGEALVSTRLLTLVGPGGAGKTRLALEVARSCADSFRHGVWFVELAPLSDAGHVPQTIASALGIAEQLERTAVEALIDHLRANRTLLVLDNCEHLIEACSTLVAELLASCAELTVMATSREALRTAGELAWRVPLLSVPASGSSEPDEVATSDAVCLFVERARLVQPDFGLTSRNAGLIAEICRQLDGLPLSIELAAARVPVLTIDELAKRLGNALQLLVGGSRTAEPRHQTVRATLTWSFDLLTANERRVFERASVFAGGWTLEAIEEVAAGEEVTPAAVLDLLANLVDKSLVVTQLDARGRLRYRLLEPVRQYADECLVAAADEQLAHRGHATWFLALAEFADERLHGHEQKEWLERLDVEHDNLRAALAWALQSDPEIAIRLSAVLWRFWYIRGHLREARVWIDRAASLAEAQSPALRAQALLASGRIRTAQCEYDDARPMLEHSLALLRELGDTRGVCDALSILAMSLYNQSEFVRARQYVEENLELERIVNDPWRLSRSLSNLAEMAYAQGDQSTAERYWMECLSIDIGLGDTRDEAITLHNLGEVARARHDLDGARRRFAEALERFRELNFLLGMASALSSLAEVMIEQDDPAAEPTLDEGLQAARALGHPVVTATLLEMVGKCAATRGETQRAARLFGGADGIRASTGAQLSPFERSKLEPWLSDTRDAGPEELRWAWTTGRAAPIDVLLDEAAAMFTPAATFERVRADVAGQLSSTLTARELEVVALIAAEMTNRQIAAQLGVARATADKHVGNILRKLELTGRSDVRRWAAVHGVPASEPPASSTDT